MAIRRKPYRKPRTDAERVIEAQKAIGRIAYTMNSGDNRFGEYGRNCRDAIARWQQVIDRNGKL